MSLKGPDDLLRENEDLRDRLSRLSEASLRINESLDFDDVLQGVLDSARALTGARYGVIALHGDSGVPEDFLSSGFTEDEADRLWTIHGWPSHFEYLSAIAAPLRLPDLLGHIRSLGLPELRPPVAMSEKVSFLASGVLHLGERVGSIYLAEKERGREFTQEDEETLVTIRVPGGNGHCKRPQAQGGTTGEKRPGDPDRHSHRWASSSSTPSTGEPIVPQPGSDAGSWTS